MQQTDQRWRDNRAPLPSLSEAAKLLGGKVDQGRILCPGPDHSRADRSLSVWLEHTAPEGFGVHSYAGDDPLLCRDYVRDRLGLPEFRPGLRSRPLQKRRAVRPAVESDTGQQAAEIWRGAISLRGTVGETYYKSRGLEVDHSIIGAVRFHHSLYFKGGTTPGIVALFRDVLSNEPCGIHRTFLDGAGRKLDRRMLGRAKDAAIKLDPDDDVTAGLHIGEGVETCVAARHLGYRPVWALGSAGAIAAFPMLAGIEAITVFAENDNASNLAAEACAARYESAGVEAWICEPPSGDMNDILLRSAA